MTRNEAKTMIRGLVRESISEIKQEILREQVRKEVIKALNEGFYNEDYFEERKSPQKGKEETSDTTEDNKVTKMRGEVLSMLKDDKYDLAAIAAIIWPDMEENTRRPLFWKCVYEFEEEDGTKREFSNEDIVKIHDYLKNSNRG